MTSSNATKLGRGLVLGYRPAHRRAALAGGVGVAMVLSGALEEEH